MTLDTFTIKIAVQNPYSFDNDDYNNYEYICEIIYIWNLQINSLYQMSTKQNY